VVLQVLVDTRGAPRKVRVVSGPPVLAGRFGLWCLLGDRPDRQIQRNRSPRNREMLCGEQRMTSKKTSSAGHSFFICKSAAIAADRTLTIQVLHPGCLQTSGRAFIAWRTLKFCPTSTVHWGIGPDLAVWVNGHGMIALTTMTLMPLAKPQAGICRTKCEQVGYGTGNTIHSRFGLSARLSPHRHTPKVLPVIAIPTLREGNHGLCFIRVSAFY
jgi:hypothetical protein